LGRAVAYKLNPSHRKPVDELRRAQPQKLPSSATALDSDPLKALLRVDVIHAQRGLGTEEAAGVDSGADHSPGLFSHQLKRFTEDFFDPDSLDRRRQDELLLTLAKSERELDEALNRALEAPLKEVRNLGYPGLNEPQEMVLHSRVRPDRLLDHSTAVQYRMAEDAVDAQHLPEHAIGLGYQNLLSLSFRLLEFRRKREHPRADTRAGQVPPPAPVHLVLVEEPEAHLHVQVQQNFVRRAYRLLSPEEGRLPSQLVLTTHSSHIAHALPFSNLRFFRRMPAPSPTAPPTSVIVDLTDVFDDDTNTRRFVERYLELQHSDLFFADAAIFIEGAAERMLIPSFIKRDVPGLGVRYLSFLEVGGSHAHRWKPLVERLGLRTLVITDLDPTEEGEMTDKKGRIRKTYTKAPVNLTAKQTSANPTLRQWIPGEAIVTTLIALPDEDCVKALGNWPSAQVKVVYQVPPTTNSPCASSFEDALVLENRSWFRVVPKDKKGPLGTMQTMASEPHSDGDLAGKLHALLSKRFDKGAFALEVLSQVVGEGAGEAKKPRLECPRYVLQGLRWLDRELTLEAPGGVA